MKKKRGFYKKSKLEKIKSSLDEVKFLTSDSYRLFLQKIVQGTTGRYDINVIFSEGVYTDNKVISVNPVHEHIAAVDGIANKTLIVLGQLAHEVFHIIYTDFGTLEKIHRMRRSEYRKLQLQNMMNIIEDAAIEYIGTNYYTGSFRQAIIALNENALNAMPSLEELTIKGAPRLTIFKQACAMYCILGTIKGKIYDSEVLEMFEEAIPYLDKGRLGKDSWARLKYAEKVYDIMLPLIEEAEKMGTEADDSDLFEYTKSEGMGGSDSPSEAPTPSDPDDFTEEEREKLKEELKKMKEMAKEKEERDSKDEGEESSDDKGGSKADSADSDDTESEGTSSEGYSDSDEADTEGDPEPKSPDSMDSENSDSKETSSMSDSKEDEEKDKSSGKDKEAETDSEEKAEKETEREVKKREELEAVKEKLEKQLKDLESDVAREEYDKEEQRRIDSEIKAFARDVKFSDIHRGTNSVATRSFHGDEDAFIELYKRDYESIKSLSRSLTKNLQDIIRYNEDVKTTGLISGRVNRSQLYRQDKRVFYKRREKSNEADLAILLLVDESGSMSHYGRDKYARLSSMILYDVCEKLSIPFATIGFDASFKDRTVFHRHYVDFDSRNSKEKYNLARIKARCDNNDGYSVKYAGEYLKRREEADKILIVISDGAPLHGKAGYFGPAAVKDTGRVVQELERDGIQVYGLAIGDGKTQIKKIYTKNYIDIPNLKSLPNRLVRIVEMNLLKD